MTQGIIEYLRSEVDVSPSDEGDDDEEWMKTILHAISAGSVHQKYQSALFRKT